MERGILLDWLQELDARFPRSRIPPHPFEGHPHIMRLLNFQAGPTLTIATGDVTRTHTNHAIETEGGAGSDTLTRVLGGRLGDWLMISPRSGNDIIVEHSSVTGGLFLNDGGTFGDLTLTESWHFIAFRHSGVFWVEQWRSSALVRARVSKSVIFASPSDTLAVEDWIPDQAVRVPAASQHGAWTPGTFYVRVGVAGTGTNTVLFRTSTTLTGARTTRATANLGTAREASGAITWTPADGQYMWVAVSAVGGTPPQKGVAQADLVERAF